MTDSLAAAAIAPPPTGATNAEPIDIVILSNGPGEVATWVKPVARSLRQKAANTAAKPATNIRISVILSPCPHASGQEHTTAATYDEIDRVQSAPNFFTFLLTGKTADNWDWHPQGIVVFLGGDQLYTYLVAKRLGYRTLTYAEWDARWPNLIDRFGVMQANLIQKAPARHQHKFTAVGDLMADVQGIANRKEITDALECTPETNILGFLPGSKPTKLSIGVPLMLAIARLLDSTPTNTERKYVIGVAPNLTLSNLIHYTNPAVNPAVGIMNAPPAKLIEPATGLPYLQIEKGPKIFLWQRFPALDLFSQCTLCFTTVGANTAQLGALAIPMIVLLPTQKLDGLKIADGLPGLIARLPGVGAIARKIINPIVVSALRKSGKKFAWPNIWAKREVVPELFGPVTPADVTELALDYLNHPEKLETIRKTLRELRGPAGAADKMADLILETVTYPK